MDILRHQGGTVPLISGKLPSLKQQSNAFTWTTKYRAALKNYYGYAPEDSLGTTGSNSYVYFLSDTPNTARVDWGDGTVEELEFTYLDEDYKYGLLFRSMNDEHYNIKTDGSYSNFFTKADGTTYSGFAPHIYSDGNVNTERTVSIIFEADVKSFVVYACTMAKFPTFSCDTLEEIRLEYINLDSLIDDIPIDIFKYVPNLKILSLDALFSTPITTIPSSMFTLTKLEEVRMYKNFYMYDIDACGIRNISKLKKLKSLSIGACSLPKYIKEFNDLPLLESLNITSYQNYRDFKVDGSPSFEEVDAINPSIRNLILFHSENTNQRKSISDIDLSGKGLEYLTAFWMRDLQNITDTKMPDYILEMRSLGTISFILTALSQTAADKIVNAFYDMVTEWEYSTMGETALDGKRNQFYGLTVEWQTSSGQTNAMPSGTLQAPSEFVQGVSNGNPSTPMEKVYVLVANYNMNFT